MKTDYAKVAVLGFKILAAVVGGVALFAGLSKMVGKSNSQPEEDNDEQPDEGQCLTEEEWNERPPRRGCGLSRCSTASTTPATRKSSIIIRRVTS